MNYKEISHKRYLLSQEINALKKGVAKEDDYDRSIALNKKIKEKKEKYVYYSNIIKAIEKRDKQ